VHARTGEQRTVSAKKSAKNRFMDMIAMQLPLGMRKYIINALSSSPERLQRCDPFLHVSGLGGIFFFTLFLGFFAILWNGGCDIAG
jgi:hypothetical protein